MRRLLKRKVNQKLKRLNENIVSVKIHDVKSCIVNVFRIIKLVVDHVSVINVIIKTIFN